MMEEQASWKTHSFTLFVFAGIVVLCSIFFILGMLVGRAQGQKIASAGPGAAASKNEAKAPAKDDKPELTFYESIKKEEPPALQPPAATPDPAPLPTAPLKKAVPEPAAGASAAAPPRPANVVNYQIAALRKASDAEKLVNEVKKKGFRAFILAPPDNDPNPFFRVQVGPFADLVEAQGAKNRLESEGYQAILKK